MEGTKKNLPQPTDLRGCQHNRDCAAFRIDELTGYFSGEPCDCGAQARWMDLASKRLAQADAEIAALTERVNKLTEKLKRWVAEGTDEIVARDKEIAALRAKLAAMREPLWMLREEHEAEVADLRGKLAEAECRAVRWVVVGSDEFRTLKLAGWYTPWFATMPLPDRPSYLLMVPPVPLPEPETK